MQILLRLKKICLTITAVAFVLIASPADGAMQHAIAMHGQPKYHKGFTAFDYVNPEAPKRGTLKQGAIGTFDSFNPFVINGIPPAGIGLTYDTLMKQSSDEPFSLYGLIADGIEVPKDRSYVAFHINPAARFNDGSTITADDVIFSFEALRDKGQPTYRYYYNDVAEVKKVDDQTVLFKFKPRAHNRELPLILGELPVLSKAFWQNKDFSKTLLEVPVSSGAYRIKSFEPGRSIVYERDPKYWAIDLNVNKGYYNFDEIKFDYYRDATVLTEAFKAGAIDIRQENEAKKWAAFETYPAIKDGRMKRLEFTHHLPGGMQGFVYNTRRPIFKDRKVRKALAYAFDFNWANANLFHNLYKRTDSYFDNSFLKAPPLPSVAEIKLLEPYKNDLPSEVFTTEYKAPENKSGNIRDNLAKALDILKQAGWSVHDGILKNDQGQPFEFELLLDSASAPAWERIALPFVGQLKRLGIKARVSIVDVIQYKNRLDSFDFDMIVYVWGQSLSPGNEQRYFWGSEAADSHGSSNFAGVKNAAVDALIERVITATTAEELQTAVHALDRVLLWNYLVIPHWYAPVHRFIFWDKFDMPASVPMKGVNTLTWWMKN